MTAFPHLAVKEQAVIFDTSSELQGHNGFCLLIAAAE
jgi:hypothetical protein